MKNIYGISLVIVSLLLASCSGGKGPARQPVAVRVDTVSSSNTATAYTYTGTIEENSSSQLSFLVGGTLRQVDVQIGQSVKKGQRLASLDDSSLKDAHVAASANLEKALDAYRRMKMLHDAGSLPDIKWVEVETSVAQARSLERIAAKDVRDAVLYAPFDGVIAERYTDSGVNVGPTVPVLRLVKIDRVYAVVSVPEGDVADITVGMEALVSVGAAGGGELPGIVAEKGVTANLLSHTYPVKVTVDNPARILMPGMVCSVDVQSPEPLSQIIVPPSAVQTEDKGRTFVWLALDGKADKRVVSPGGLVKDGVVIDSGLSPGDAVIVQGNQKVNQGMNIVVQ